MKKYTLLRSKVALSLSQLHLKTQNQFPHLCPLLQAVTRPLKVSVGRNRAGGFFFFRSRALNLLIWTNLQSSTATLMTAI